MTFHSSFIPLFLSTNIFMFSLHINSHIALLPNIFQHLLHQNLSVSTFSNCPYFSIPYNNTHHSDQFRTLLLAPYCHHNFQLLFVARPFSASLVTSSKHFSLSSHHPSLYFLRTLSIHGYSDLLHSFTNTIKHFGVNPSFNFLSPHEYLNDPSLLSLRHKACQRGLRA